MQFLILQTKKGRQDEAEATKKAAEAARTLAKGRPAPLRRPAPATSSTPITPTTPTTAPATTSSPLSTRSALITGKRARNDDEGEVAGSPPAKRPRQVDLPQLRFTSFSVSFRGPNSFRIHYTTYFSVNKFPSLVRWVREKAPQPNGRSMLLKTTITVRNNEYLDLLPDTELGGRVEMIISDQGSWNAALMMAQGNRPNEGSYTGLLVVAVAATEDSEHGVEEEIGPDHTSEDEDEQEPRRGNHHGNSRSGDGGDGGEGASQPTGLPTQSRRTGGGGATEAGDNSGDGGSGQGQDAGGDGDGGDGGGGDGGDNADGGNNNNGNDSDGGDDDLYSHPSK